jgi:hypothetical protein
MVSVKHAAFRHCLEIAVRCFSLVSTKDISKLNAITTKSQQIVVVAVAVL